MKLENFLHQRYLYGGKITRLGDIIIDLQNQTKDHRKIDAYLTGLFHNQEPINPITAKVAL